MSLFDSDSNPKIMPVVVIENANDAPGLAEAFLKGGLNWIEITLRTEAAYEAIPRIIKEFPDMMVGAGTVVSVEQAKRVADYGSTFALSPGLDVEVIEYLKGRDVPFIPGIATASEMMLALKHGCRHLKFFPAEAAGGVKYLKSVLAPLKSFGVQICPTGGLNLNNMVDYLAIPQVFTIGGSWLATADQIKNHDWKTITQQVKDALAKT